MECSTCGARPVVFSVPEVYREHVPENAARAVLCPECLTLTAADTEATETEPRFDRISDMFPTGEAAVPLAIGIGLLDSIALNRASIEALFRAAEAAGADPLLLLRRLDVQDGVSPGFDLGRRRHQLEQIFD